MQKIINDFAVNVCNIIGGGSQTSGRCLIIWSHAAALSSDLMPLPYDLISCCCLTIWSHAAASPSDLMLTLTLTLTLTIIRSKTSACLTSHLHVRSKCFTNYSFMIFSWIADGCSRTFYCETWKHVSQHPAQH